MPQNMNRAKRNIAAIDLREDIKQQKEETLKEIYNLIKLCKS